MNEERPTEIISVPNYGLKVKLSHSYPECRSQNYTPSWKVLWEMLPLIIRYVVYYILSKLRNKSIVMDYIYVQQAKQIYGVPVGGIGAGTIGRGFRGEFCRFQLRPGLYEWSTVEANQFIVTIKDSHQKTIFHSLLSTFPKKSLKYWESHVDGNNCLYTGLYPRSWIEYDLSEYGIKLVCRQVSPVIPHNYIDSSLPCSVFIWSIKNVSLDQRTVTIAFTFKSGIGNRNLDSAATCSSEEFSFLGHEGVLLNNTIDSIPCSYVLSASNKSQLDNVSKCLYFDPKSDGKEPWYQLKNDGHFAKSVPKNITKGEIACGLATQTTTKKDECKEIEMCLVWDMPKVNFPKNGKKYDRMYTKYFSGKNAAAKIVDYAFSNYPNWEKEIFMWQSKVLNNRCLPDWYKSNLFNQLYFISDGGSIWVQLNDDDKSRLPPEDIRRECGRFAYLEGHEYKMYNTYDVHFYGSFALCMNWPFLQRSLQYDIRDSIYRELPQKVEMLYDGRTVERKVPNTVPHDIGDPGEEPFLLPNSYPIHDVSEWRDLGSKFVLQTFRDGVSGGVIDIEYFRSMYDACFVVVNEMMKFDVDNDGLIENSGVPDQTYDTWIMSGSSAYCGGLWLAALFAMAKMAEYLDIVKDRLKFEKILEKGKISFEKKLWNGVYYNFDSSKNESKSIMADQLCGHWYLRTCGFGYEIFQEDHVKSALRLIYEKNVQSFRDGTLGAVNGFIEDDIDYFTIQSQEVWTGVTYALAATMIYEGLVEEGFKTAGGMTVSMIDLFGLSFDIPEALYAHKYYRSIGYMRPLSIWSMQLALENRNLTLKN